MIPVKGKFAISKGRRFQKIILIVMEVIFMQLYSYEFLKSPFKEISGTRKRYKYGN